jgi:hypothetical protein
MRRTLAYLIHPVRLTALGLLGALALTVLMLAGRPEAPPEAEAFSPNSISVSPMTAGEASYTLTAVFSFNAQINVGDQLFLFALPSSGDISWTGTSLGAGTSLGGANATGFFGSSTSLSFFVDQAVPANTQLTLVVDGWTDTLAAGVQAPNIFAELNNGGTVDSGVIGTITLTDPPTPSAAIEKTVVGADVSTSFAATAPASPTSFSLMNGGLQDLGLDTAGQTTTVTETIPSWAGTAERTASMPATTASR